MIELAGLSSMWWMRGDARWTPPWWFWAEVGESRSGEAQTWVCRALDGGYWWAATRLEDLVPSPVEPGGPGPQPVVPHWPVGRISSVPHSPRQT